MGSSFFTLSVGYERVGSKVRTNTSYRAPGKILVTSSIYSLSRLNIVVYFSVYRFVK